MRLTRLTLILTRRSALLFILTALLTLLLEGCNQVQIHDEVIYAIKPRPLGALEAHTLTTDERDLSQAEWDKISPGMLCMSAQAFGDYKALEEELCSYNPSECTYDTQSALTTFFRKAKRLHNKAVKQ